MAPPNKSDEEIIRLILSGKKADREEAAAHLCKKYRKPIGKQIRAMAGNRVEVDEIFNDSILVLMKNVENGKYEQEKGKLANYLWGIAKRKTRSAVQDYWRKIKENLHRLQEQKHIPRDNPIENSIFDDEQRRLIRKALQKLGEKCRELLRRYWYKGEALKDIAEDMGISEAAAKKRHQRCREKLKEIMGRDPRI